MAETSRASILLIYTGGTIGMKTNPETGALSPFDFNDMYEEFPYLRMLNVDISVLHFKPIDSSNVTPALWIELARLIRDSYASFDGFVVLHGTDTMAYSASALSFMIENLGKPVVFATHNVDLIRNDEFNITRVIVMDEGEIAFDGEPASASAYYAQLIRSKYRQISSTQ